MRAVALDGLPEVGRDDDLAGLVVGALARTGDGSLIEGDVLVFAHKVVSKSEGRVRTLAEIVPGERATALAAQLGKDPRHIQAVLDETADVLRAERGVLICQTHHGFVCANAGVDASNVPGEDTVALLPADPDRSARELRRRFRELTGIAPAVLITDSFGRAWRLGQSDVAIGCAGILPIADWRGRTDAAGRELTATMIAVADQLAAAADLARAKDSGEPVVLVRGAGVRVTKDDGPGARALLRPRHEDLFR